jgi:O-antigen/teichoic acid export membrane protein
MTSAAPALERLARRGTANLVGAIATGLCTFGLTVVIARRVPQVEVGVFFSTTSLFLVAITVGQLGTQTALVYFVARSRVAGRAAHSDAYVGIALRAVLTVAGLMALAMLLFARPLAEATSPGHVAAATTFFRVLAPFIPAAALELALLAATRGLGSMRATTFIEQIGRPAAQLVLVTAATALATTTALGLAWSVAYLPAAFAAWLSWRRRRARQLVAPPGDDDQPSARRFWAFALPRALTSMLQVLMQRFDIVLVGALAGATDAAVYAAATRFVVVGQLATNAFTTATQPQLAARLASDDTASATELYRASTAWLVLVTWPMYFTMIVFAKPLLLVFGHSYTTGDTTIVLIACSMLVSTGVGVVDTVLAMGGRTSWNLGNAALALTVNIGLDVLLIPRHGILGAAIGWAVAIVVRNVAAVLQLALRLGVHPFARPTWTAAGLTAICYFAILVLVRGMLGGTLLAACVGVLVGTVLYVAGLWLLRDPLRLTALSALRRANDSSGTR